MPLSFHKPHHRSISKLLLSVCKENNGEVCFEIVPIFEKDNLPAIYFEKRFLNIVNYLDAVIDIDMYLN